MMRFVATALIASLGIAPVQCAHKPDPDVRREDGPDDALWALAHDFRAKGNEAAAQETLRYLAEKYPASRHAVEARAETSGDAAAKREKP
jgi:hypothetical protein